MMNESWSAVSVGSMNLMLSICGMDEQEALLEFLRRYRETPHSTTGVSPNHLLLGFSRSSGIPSMVPETPEQVNDARAKNHGITCLISLARVNELFENTSLTGANVNRQLFFHSSYRSNPYI